MSRDEIADALKPDRAIILNRICDQFESDWRNGERDRIEEMLNYTKGIKFSELDLETKKLTVKYATKKISLAEIKTKLSELGYDADEVKSNPESVKKLPLCCQPGGIKNQ